MYFACTIQKYHNYHNASLHFKPCKNENNPVTQPFFTTCYLPTDCVQAGKIVCPTTPQKQHRITQKDTKRYNDAGGR